MSEPSKTKERKKAEADEEQKRLKFELAKGSSRASGSVADEIESVGPRRNHERTGGWAESVAQQSVSSDHYLQALLSTQPVFQPVQRVFSTQLPEPSILKTQEILKSIRATDPPPPLTGTTFQHQETSAAQNRNRSQSLINNSKQEYRQQKQEHTELNHSPNLLPTSIKQWFQWPAKTKTD